MCACVMRQHHTQLCARRSCRCALGDHLSLGHLRARQSGLNQSENNISESETPARAHPHTHTHTLRKDHGVLRHACPWHGSAARYHASLRSYKQLLIKAKLLRTTGHT